MVRDVLRVGPAQIDVYGSRMELPRLAAGTIREDGQLTVWVNLAAPGADVLAGVQVTGRVPGWLARRLEGAEHR